MNTQKIITALSAAKQLACGGLVIEGGAHRNAGHCAVGQLFHFAGKTDEEIMRETSIKKGKYEHMFDGLLAREYDMTLDDVDWLWSINDHFMVDAKLLDESTLEWDAREARARVVFICDQVEARP